MKEILPFLGLMLLFFSSSCKKPTAFDYRDIKNIRVESFGTSSSKVSMELVFFNPNNYGVNLKNVDCKLYIDSSYLGRFVLDTLMRIPKSAEFTIPASMQVDMKGLLKNSLNLIFNNEIIIKARGTSKVGKGGFFVTIPFDYEGKQKINFFQ